MLACGRKHIPVTSLAASGRSTRAACASCTQAKQSMVRQQMHLASRIMHASPPVHHKPTHLLCIPETNGAIRLGCDAQ
jgi:hypothetical protein